MSWVIAFLGLVVLVVAISLALRFWSGVVERERPERRRLFLDTMREASAGGGVTSEHEAERRTPRSRVVLLILLGAAIGLIGLSVWLLLGPGVTRAAGGIAVIGVGWALGLFSPALATWLLRKR
jgi:hypothetical protein